MSPLTGSKYLHPQPRPVQEVGADNGTAVVFVVGVKKPGNRAPIQVMMGVTEIIERSRICIAPKEHQVVVGGACLHGRPGHLRPARGVRWDRVASFVALVAVAGTLIQFGPDLAWFGAIALAGLVLSPAPSVPMVAPHGEAGRTTS